MASIETRIEQFIALHKLKPALKDDLCELITGSMQDMFKHVFTIPVPPNGGGGSTKKADKIENPATCESVESLNKCTMVVLHQFCKENKLKTVGNKEVLVKRVWYFLQGTVSDNDKVR